MPSGYLKHSTIRHQLIAELTTIFRCVVGSTGFENKLKGLITSSPLPDHPDRHKADEWLINAYKTSWSLS